MSPTADRPTFSLQGRPGAGLYAAGWVLSVVGLIVAFVGAATGPPISGVLLMGGLVLLMIGLSSAAGYQVVIRSTRPLTMFRGPSPFLVFAIQLVLVNIASALLIIFGILPADESALSPAQFLVTAIVLLAGYVTVVGLFAIRTGALDLRGLGLPVGSTLRRWLSDITFGAVVLLITAVLVDIWGGLLAVLLNSNTPSVVPAPTTGLDAVYTIIGACILVPIGEELLFRGYSLTAWLRDLGPRAGLIRATLFFAVVHILNVAVDPTQNDAALNGLKQALLEFLVIAPVGLALGWVYLRRGLAASIAGHAVFNLYAVLLLLVYQGVIH